MRIGVVAFGFPQPSETFVVRHVVGLDAVVFAESILQDSLRDVSGVPRCYEFGVAIDNPVDLLRRVWVYGSRMLFGRPGIIQPRDSSDRLREALLDSGVDVLLVEFGHLALSILPVVRNLGIPMIPHFHGYDASVMLKRDYYCKQLSSLFDYASKVVTVNSRQATRLKRLGCCQSKLHVIPCGADVSRFRADRGHGESEIRFLCVGRMMPVKGPLFSLRAFQRCKETVPKAKLVMVGGGPMLERCKAWVRKRSMADSVEFLGVQSHDRVATEMERASVFVQHSITLRNGAAEGWSVAIAEAAASGLPVVATDSGGISENVREGKTGFLVQEKDWAGMAEHMVKLALDSELRNRMGRDARLHAEKYCNAELQVRKLRDLIGEAVVE